MILKNIGGAFELVLFIPLFFLVVLIAFRRRSIKLLPWMFLATLCLIRIISAALEVNYSRMNENLSDHAGRTIILDNIALCLLLLTILGFLTGINDSLSPTYLRENGLIFLHVPCIVATILCIAGATYLPSESDSRVNAGKTLFRAGWVILLFEYLILTDLNIILAIQYRRDWRDKHLLVALVFSHFFMIQRFVYGLLAGLTDITVYSYFADGNSNALVRFLAGVGMEFFVVAMYTAVGLIMPRGQPRRQASGSGKQASALRGESLESL